MQSAWRLLVSGAIVGAALVAAQPSTAKPEYTRRTKKECAFCHPPGGYTLNDAGRYFREHRTLEGYKEKPQEDVAE